MKALAARLLAIIALAFVAILSIAQLNPPGSDRLDGFETNRALDHLQVISAVPHPSGSDANDEVRDYLVQHLKSLGLETHSDEQNVSLQQPGNRERAIVQNVVARLRGSSEAPSAGQAVMLSAHYDSVAAGPGASDDGAAVAALLDVARVLSEGPRLKRDLIFLFTDGEERGLLGARAFVTDDPWRSQPGVVFNFEARGTSGPSIMFETSRGNDWLIREFAAVARHPVTTSLAGDIYRQLPNDTDFTIFRQSGIQGLNFAFIGKAENYHQPTDDLQHLDVRSLRHHSEQALSLARHFASLDAFGDEAKSDDAVYFDIFSAAVMHAPARVIATLTLVTSIAFPLLAIIVLWKRRILRRWRIVGASIGCALAVVVTILLDRAMLSFVGRQFLVADADQLRYVLIAMSFTVSAIAAAVAIRCTDAASGAIASLIIWSMIGGVVSRVAAGGSYLPLAAVFCGAVFVLLDGWFKPSQIFRRTALLLLCTAPLVAIVTPFTLLASTALPMQAAPLVMVLPAIVGLMIGQLFASGGYSAVSAGGGPTSSTSPPSEAPSKSIRK